MDREELEVEQLTDDVCSTSIGICALIIWLIMNRPSEVGPRELHRRPAGYAACATRCEAARERRRDHDRDGARARHPSPPDNVAPLPERLLRGSVRGMRARGAGGREPRRGRVRGGGCALLLGVVRACA
jgi:hypothetical protein